MEDGWNMYGMCTEQHGMGREYAWNMDGIGKGYAWNMYGMTTKQAWHVDGTDL